MSKLSKLHGLLAGRLIAALEDTDGDPLTPALLREVREFLKDNGITEDPRRGKVRELADVVGELRDDELPFRVPLSDPPHIGDDRTVVVSW